MDDPEVLDWLRAAHEGSTWTTSVCTGSLVLGAAGILDGKRATTHWAYMERLRELGAEPVTERVVEDGKIITAAGVSAGIDMALTAGRPDRGRRGGAGDPAGHRVRPGSPVRLRLARQGVARVIELVRAARGRLGIDREATTQGSRARRRPSGH